MGIVPEAFSPSSSSSSFFFFLHLFLSRFLIPRCLGNFFFLHICDDLSTTILTFFFPLLVAGSHFHPPCVGLSLSFPPFTSSFCFVFFFFFFLLPFCLCGLKYLHMKDIFKYLHMKDIFKYATFSFIFIFQLDNNSNLFIYNQLLVSNLLYIKCGNSYKIF
jgi:hypothetical protein